MLVWRNSEVPASNPSAVEEAYDELFSGETAMVDVPDELDAFDDEEEEVPQHYPLQGR